MNFHILYHPFFRFLKKGSSQQISLTHYFGHIQIISRAGQSELPIRPILVQALHSHQIAAIISNKKEVLLDRIGPCKSKPWMIIVFRVRKGQII